MRIKGSALRTQYKQKTVTVMIRANVDGKWIRSKAVYGKSGRVVPGLVVYKGQELRLSDVSYDLRFYKAGKPQYRPAGKSACDAEEQKRVLSGQLSAQSFAESVGMKIDVEPERLSLKQWSAKYVSKRSVDLGKDQIGRIKYVIGLFFECCKMTYLDEITEMDLLNFIAHLSALPVFRNSRRKPSSRRNAVQRRKRCPVQHRLVSERTVFNYYTVACKWLSEGGVDSKVFPRAPKFEQPEVTIYTPDQLQSLFSVVSGSLRIALGLMLKCGLRRKEVAFAYFSDINFAEKTILVRGKPEWNFKVKNRVQRYVPIPDDLIEELRQWAADHSGRSLIIQTDSGRPELSLIKKLKRFAYLHGLRCGRCAHCRSGNPECEDWELHKFRRTYATALVRHVDLRTAQEYLGHTRITSTERYLRAASAADGQKTVSAIAWTRPFYS
jgi:integrase